MGMLSSCICSTLVSVCNERYSHRATDSVRKGLDILPHSSLLSSKVRYVLPLQCMSRDRPASGQNTLHTVHTIHSFLGKLYCKSTILTLDPLKEIKEIMYSAIRNSNGMLILSIIQILLFKILIYTRLNHLYRKSYSLYYQPINGMIRYTIDQSQPNYSDSFSLSKLQ